MPMKFKSSIALFMLFIAFLAVTALSADWGSQQSLSAAELISGTEYAAPTGPGGTPATPQQSRALQENKSDMDWTMPKTLSDTAKNPLDSRAEAEAASSEEESAPTTTPPAEENASAMTETELPPAEVALPSLGGSWSFSLNDSIQRSMALTLFQNDGQVFGAGKMRVNNSTIDAAVSGQVYGNGSAELDVITINPIDLYKLYLNLNGDMANGEFNALSAGKESWTGSFEGVKTA